MRKILLFIILLTLVACQDQDTPKDAHPITVEITPLVTTKADTAILAQRQRLMQKELDYYMSRHTMQDEGYDMVTRYNAEGSAMLASFTPKELPTIASIIHPKYIKRQGFGIAIDTQERVILGLWESDTLTSGLRIDANGIYGGQFNRDMQASGHGCYLALDGSYYEGQWLNDQREGFGFAVTTKNLQAGTWRKGRFYGEHMQHTSDRIYGIDISRYQHEKGRRRYSIDWHNLRITHLGRRIKGNITGEVNYPVRFVYIKSTQGTTIRNRYFANDYAAARRNGVPVGAYHFFSTLKSGSAQATYFLQNTLFRRGDLPPVLDIEPSNAQIKKMGGTEALMHEIRKWINAIEKRHHVRPILYVNQRFINEHLVQAPDLMENYLVWIARYGEYKPGVHLALWQASADAKVNGIATDVDVNVFNGYEPQWDEFLSNETIK